MFQFILKNRLFIIFFFSVLCWQCNWENTTDKVLFSDLDENAKRLPENAMLGLAVEEDLQLSLFAHEPMLVNPTNIDVDHKGRIWVCEAYNYRNWRTGNPKKEAGDRILILTDNDQDGQADESTVFYQDTSLNAPLGIWVMDNQVIVSQSPYVWLLTDTNRDDRADRKEIIFQGIGGNQHDHGVHAFVFGPDGRFYFNFGNSGEKLLDGKGQPVRDVNGQPIDFSTYQEGMVFRCDTNFQNIEVLGDNFRNPYEVSLDSYGRIWQSDNDDDGNRGVRINYVMDYGNYGFKDEITKANWRTPRTNMADSIPFRHWHLNDPGVIPNMLQTGAGSPTGILVYEGDLLPERFHNQLIHSDAGPNVVRSYSIQEQGAGYSAVINNMIQENGDQWFRPSDVCVAPDGSVFVSDWYDPGVGGHQIGDLQRGRIYRITPNSMNYAIAPLDVSSPEEAMKGLFSPNLSTRYVAWKALHQRGDDVESLLLQNWQSEENALAHRARCLWLLTKLPQKGHIYIKQALDHSEVYFQEIGWRAARQNTEVDILSLMAASVADTQHPAILREMAISLKGIQGETADQIWTQLFKKYNGDDRWYLEALGIGAEDLWPDRMGSIYPMLNGAISPVHQDLIWRSRDRASLPYLAQLAGEKTQPLKARLRYFRAFDFHPNTTQKNKVLLDLALTYDGQDQTEVYTLVLSHIDPAYVNRSYRAKQWLAKHMDTVKGEDTFLDLIQRFELRNYLPALTTYLHGNVNKEAREKAVQLLLKYNQPEPILSSLNKENETDQMAILEVLYRKDHPSVVNQLRTWVQEGTVSDKVKEKALFTLASLNSAQAEVLEMLEADQLSGALKLVAIQGLNQSRNAEIRNRALKYMQTADQSKYAIEDLVNQTGDPSIGKKVFEKNCALCHQIDTMGHDFGPGLSNIGRKLSKEGQFSAILFPSAGISFGYEGYTLSLKNGTTTSGIILNQTENELTLKFPGGSSQTYAMSEVEKIEMMVSSMMPEGLENSMQPQELVDLVAYLMTLK